MTPDVEVSRTIAASPETVYNAITDITRMGEWSPESFGTTWNDGFTKAEPGAEFTGQNKNGEFEWTIMSRVTETTPNERFTFDCVAGDFVFSTWSYKIEPAEGGCVVTEQWKDFRPEAVKPRGEEISGVADRVAHNRAGMEVTLERLAAAVEQ